MFQFQLVRLKFSLFAACWQSSTVSIPTGSIKIVKMLKFLRHEDVSIPTGSIKMNTTHNYLMRVLCFNSNWFD